MSAAPLSAARRLELLEPPSGRVRIVLDTDTYNEIDDQFAVTWALLSPEAMTVEAIYAAPFHNERSRDAGHGMDLSYDEILQLLSRLDVPADGFVHRGVREYVGPASQPRPAPAVDDLGRLKNGRRYISDRSDRDHIQRLLGRHQRPRDQVVGGGAAHWRA